MSDYFIQFIDKRVCVSRIKEGEPEPIRINGDFDLPLSEFWELFKTKIEYEADEKLAFIVLSDNENFEIDSGITIAEKFTLAEEDIKAVIFENRVRNHYLMTYPKVDMDFNQSESLLPASVPIRKLDIEQKQGADTDSLQSFFRKKTRAMKQGITNKTMEKS